MGRLLAAGVATIICLVLFLITLVFYVSVAVINKPDPELGAILNLTAFGAIVSIPIGILLRIYDWLQQRGKVS